MVPGLVPLPGSISGVILMVRVLVQARASCQMDSKALQGIEGRDIMEDLSGLGLNEDGVTSESGVGILWL